MTIGAKMKETDLTEFVCQFETQAISKEDWTHALIYGSAAAMY
jgi:hypothetical protein